jgi:hypothetical protein
VEKCQLSPGEIYVKRTLNTLDFLGFAAKHYLNVEGALMHWMNPPIAKAWKHLSGYVMDERMRRQEEDWYESAEFIGERCINWRCEEGMPDEVIVEDTV